LMQLFACARPKNIFTLIPVREQWLSDPEIVS
jgi:hypothetical protein